jgi:hypothetical protein
LFFALPSSSVMFDISVDSVVNCCVVLCTSRGGARKKYKKAKSNFDRGALCPFFFHSLTLISRSTIVSVLPTGYECTITCATGFEMPTVANDIVVATCNATLGTWETSVESFSCEGARRVVIPLSGLSAPTSALNALLCADVMHAS